MAQSHFPRHVLKVGHVPAFRPRLTYVERRRPLLQRFSHRVGVMVGISDFCLISSSPLSSPPSTPPPSLPDILPPEAPRISDRPGRTRRNLRPTPRPSRRQLESDATIWLTSESEPELSMPVRTRRNRRNRKSIPILFYKSLT